MNSMHNTNIERSVLSSFLFNPDLFYNTQSKLTSEDFYMPSHRFIYEAICTVVEQDKPIDEEFIRAELLKNSRFDEDAMLEIAATNPLPSVDAYIEELRVKAQNRAIHELTSEIKKKQVEHEHVHDILGFISQSVESIEDKNMLSKNLSIAEIADAFFEKYSHAHESKEHETFKTGLNALDGIIGSFEPGDLVVIGARPSMGKTSLATTFTSSFDKRNIGVLFDSLEMPHEKLFRRLMAERSEESLNDIKRGMIKSPEKFNRALRELRNTQNIIIHDTSYLSIHQLIAKASTVFRKNKHFKIWVIDHIRYIKKEGKKDDHIQVSEMTKMLKKFAKEHGAVVILLSQLNRANESRQNKRPTLSDIRDSGAVEEDADIVLAPHRESYYNRNDPSMPEKPINEAEVIVLKNRDGECGIAKCWFNGPTTSFNSYPSYTVHDYKEATITVQQL